MRIWLLPLQLHLARPCKGAKPVWKNERRTSISESGSFLIISFMFEKCKSHCTNITSLDPGLFFFLAGNTTEKVWLISYMKYSYTVSQWGQMRWQKAIILGTRAMRVCPDMQSKNTNVKPKLSKGMKLEGNTAIYLKQTLCKMRCCLGNCCLNFNGYAHPRAKTTSRGTRAATNDRLSPINLAIISTIS